jgi:hypothetical protein
MTLDLFKKKTCEVHGQLLEEDEVPLRYGLFRFTEEYRKAQKELFPNANSFKLAGCRIDEANNKKTTITKYCSVCRQNEKEWRSKNEARQ